MCAKVYEKLLSFLLAKERENKRLKSIILASASPRRKEIFTLADLSFEVLPSSVEEVVTKEIPHEVVMELASQKAWDIWEKTKKDRMVVGADTVVACDGKILGKPKDEEDAFKMLSMLSGRTHQVYTGVSLIWKDREHTFYEETEVTFYPMTEEEIFKYISTKEPMDKAGAYGIQGKAAAFIRGICGDYYNVVGFPIARFLQEVRQLED